MKKLIGMVFLVMMLGGCAVFGPPPGPAYIAAHPNTPPDIKADILNQQIAIGMTKAQVTAALGAYCWTCYGSVSSSFGDTWDFGDDFGGSGAAYQVVGPLVYFNADGKVIGWTN